MGSRDWPVNDAVIITRLPDELKLIIEVVAAAECNTLSYTIRKLLDSHPQVMSVRVKLNAMIPEREGTGP